MIKIPLVVLLLLFTCCKSATPQSNDTTDCIFIRFTSQVNLQNVKEFSIDTIYIENPEKETRIELIIPAFYSDSLFNVLVYNKIYDHKKYFENRVDELIADDSAFLNSVGSDFSYQPNSIYIDKKIISVCFESDVYYAGNAHGLAKYESFNYDRRQNKMIEFSDYFFLKNSDDSLKLMQLINKGIDRDNIGIEKIYEIDFDLEIDAVSFNFDDYEIAPYAEGLIKGIVPREDLKFIIKNIYR